MRDFNGKVAVITGGASGVGRSLAFALGRRGAKIAVGDVDKNAMARVRDGSGGGEHRLPSLSSAMSLPCRA